VLRVVLDPGVLISPLLSETGPPAEALDRWRAGEFDLVVSAKLLGELEGVLLRPKFHSIITEDDARTFVHALAGEAILARDPRDVPAVTPDPDDDYLIALAVEAGADAVVSGDNDLTELESPPIAVWTPGEFLARLAGSSRDPR
jgi:putative PIN family toxin of toxin-antitoxin system